MTNGKIQGIAVGAGLLVLGGGLLSACGQGSSGAATESTLKIAIEASLTGSGAPVGGPQANGIKLAVDEINAAGGIKAGGKSLKITLRVLDDESKATLAVQNVQKMLQENIHYITGTLSSASVGAYLPIIKNRDDIVSMVSGAVLPGITDTKPVYRFFNETVQLDDGKVAYAKEIGAKKVAVLTDKSHAGYVSDSTRFFNALAAQGITVTTKQEYQFGDTQYGGQIGAILRTKPDLIIGRGYATDLIRAITTARQLGYQGPFVSAAGYTEKEIADVGAQKAMAKVIDVGIPSIGYVATAPKGFDASTASEAKAFVADYKAKYGQDPGLLSANAYESVYILAAAIGKAGTATDVPKVRAALDRLTVSDVRHPLVPIVGTTLFVRHQTRFAMVKNVYSGGDWHPEGRVD